MRSDVEPSSFMNTRKRAREDDIAESLPTPKHLRLEPKPSLPTPSPTASSAHDALNQRSGARKRPSRTFPQSEPGHLKRAFDEPNSDRAPASKRRRQSSSNPWPLDRWLRERCDATLPREVLDGSEPLPTIESPLCSPVRVPASQAADDQMSQQQDGDTQAPGSVTSAQSERLNTSSPMFRGTLKMHGVIIDNLGSKIPAEVQELVVKHIRKERKSPPLGDDEKTRIKEQIKKVWDKGEPIVAGILNTSLFPLDSPDLVEVGDILWSTQPLPRNADFPYGLPAPKPDRHFGFPTSQDSDWTVQQLAAADHSRVRPYSQPTRDNMFPSFLIELKSEATKGTLYAGESQAAVSGAHRICSLLWMLDLIDPSRTQLSTDALVFSAVVSQREAVAHVHYYNPDDKTHYMSYIDIFPFQKDAQGCRNFHKNIVEWLVNIQQPIIKDVLAKLHPITKLWKKGRSASAMVDAAASFSSDDGRPTKSQKT